MKIGYARVSTDDQETHLQIDALKRAKCERIFQEKASGAKTNRPELKRMLDSARKGDDVVVWKFDRLARSIRQLLDTAALLEESGIELCSLTEQINAATPGGRLTFHLFGAQFERDILREPVTAGLKALTEEKLKKARALLRSGDYSKKEVAAELGVGRHTLWRRLAGTANNRS